MSLAAGTRLGPYEILGPLGAGGMGEVYRACDPRMGREVAIKLSGERFTDRFEREVRAVAALNHPKICHVYDVGPNYLVMELVEGPTLADRIERGAIAVEDALAIARQIGDALEAAHEKGIVHRDLKPANIKIKPDGTVKVLDFGLAKMTEPAAVAASPDQPATVTMRATIAGQIMGTPAYMAPEQARGTTVDKRADIWAFGVVVYEMLTGRCPFEGSTISDTLVAVLKHEPDWNRVPVTARRLLKRCLDKDPTRRLRDICDAWALLDEGTQAAEAAKSNLKWQAVVVVLTLLSATLAWALWRETRTETVVPALVRLDLDLGSDMSLGSTTGPAVILSPDGSRLVFISQGADGSRRLFTRRLDRPHTVPIPGTEGASGQFFSPDGQWIGFFAEGKLKKTRLDGGEPVSLCDAPAPRGATWGEDGNIIAALEAEAGLSLVPPEGGQAVPVTKLNLEVGETTHRWPQVLPGAKAVLFMASVPYGHFYDADIDVVTLKDGRIKTLLRHAGMNPRYLPNGYLVYVNKGSLFAVRFDLDRLEVRGAPALLWEVSDSPTLGFGQFDASRNGIAAYRTGGAEGLRTIEWLDGNGKTVPLGMEPAYYLMPRLSPDGSRVVYMVSQGSSQDLWTYDFERGIRMHVATGYNVYPQWTADGQFLVFQGRGGMFWTRANGPAQPQPLTKSRAIQFPYSFSPDGASMSYCEETPGTGAEIRTVPIENRSGQLHAGQSQGFLKREVIGLRNPAFSPDGQWLAFSDAESGKYEVNVRAFPDNGTQVQISNAGGILPVWSRTQHQLFYRTDLQQIMVVDYTVKSGSFVADKPRVWSPRRLANTGVAPNFDLSPDGKRILAVLPSENEPRESQSHVILIANFLDELRRRTAQGR